MDKNTHDSDLQMDTRAHAVLNAMAKGEFRNAIVHFDTIMTSLMPAEKLEEMWNAIQAKVGRFVEQVSLTQLRAENKPPTVALLCKFEKESVELYITFNEQLNVSGIHVGPAPALPTAPEAAPLRAPSPVQPDSGPHA